jgi:diguanylate cyclase (GGDEF)-like protein
MSKPSQPGSSVLAQAALTSDERRAWDIMSAELEAARARIRELEKQIRSADPAPPEEQPVILTRPEFNREVARMLASDERYGGVSSVIYFDVENLGHVAERYGKSVANAALREIAALLMKSVRASDIVGRLGGNEFGVLLGRCANDFAWKKGRELAAALSGALIEVHGRKLDLVLSYGAYTFREEQRDVGAGLKEAAQVITRAGVL